MVQLSIMHLSRHSSVLAATLLPSLFFITTFTSAAPTGSPTDCKCLPNSPCWPSNDEWRQLNASVGGMLLSNIRPIASACYEGTLDYDKERCEDVTNNFVDSAWRADQAGAVEHPTWEPYAPLEESCYLPSVFTNPTETPECKQGAIPQYGVRARSAKDVSAAVKFAAKHNIPFVIKNTGHDYLGRANRRNALMIWTHFLRDISFSNEDGKWKPAGCNGPVCSKYKEKGLLVKIDAGVLIHELYKAVSKRDRTVLAGSGPTVGPAGGYVQGGGHSLLGPWKGLASDHAVEFEVVLANGHMVKATPCTNSDLFWALRGGGGGTFGVVTSVIFRTHENPPLPQYRLNITIPITGDTDTDTANKIYWAAISKWLSLALDVNKIGGSGYNYIMPNTPVPAFNITAHVFMGILFFAGQDDTKKIEDLFKPFHEWLYTQLGGSETSFVRYIITPPNPATDYFSNMRPTEGGQGASVILGSRLISRDTVATPEGVKKLTEAIQYVTSLGGFVIGHYVAPPPNVPVDSAAHPAWRRAIIHLITTAGWENGASFKRQQEIKDLLTDVKVPKLKELDRVGGKQTMGAYLNEADKEDPEWQDSFWGEKYGRLRKIKQKYDPDGVFWCRPCVGSEDWDKDGICKVSNYGQRRSWELGWDLRDGLVSLN